SASVDSDGTISSYSWNWADGTAAGTGKTATHSYAVAGTYQVVLTVTDNGGLTGTITQPVVVTSPVPSTQVAKDDFGRSVSGGWGSADSGGTYSVVAGAASAASVTSGTGVLTLTPGNTRNMMLTTAKAQDTVTSVVFSLDAAPSTGSAYAGVIARQMTNPNDNYTTRVWLNSNGSIWLVIQHGGTALQSIQLPGITRAAGDSFNLKVSVTGTSPTTITAKVWRVGTSEPVAAQLTVTDSSAALQASGYVGLHAARSGSSTSTAVIGFSSYLVTKPN
ncbi:MAG: PKD domain-containing protein, partial [Pseudolysinimonas sp.]